MILLRLLTRIEYELLNSSDLSPLIIFSVVFMVLALVLLSISSGPRFSSFIERHRAIALSVVLIIWGIALTGLNVGVYSAVESYIGVSSASISQQAQNCGEMTVICLIFGGLMSSALVIITAVVVSLTVGRRGNRLADSAAN